MIKKSQNVLGAVASDESSAKLDLMASLLGFTALMDIESREQDNLSETGYVGMAHLFEMAGNHNFKVVFNDVPFMNQPLTMKIFTEPTDGSEIDLFAMGLPDLKDVPIVKDPNIPAMYLDNGGSLRMYCQLIKYMGFLRAPRVLWEYRKFMRNVYRTYEPLLGSFMTYILMGVVLSAILKISEKGASGFHIKASYEHKKDDGTSEERIIIIVFDTTTEDVINKMHSDNIEEIYYDLVDPSKNELVEGRVQSFLRGDAPYIAIKDIGNKENTQIIGRIFYVEKE